MKILPAKMPTDRLSWSLALNKMLDNLATAPRSFKQIVCGSFDAVASVFCLWAALSVRHDEPFSDFQATWHVFALIPLVTVILFASLGIYHWVVRSCNDRLFRQLAKGSAMSALVVVLVYYLLPPDRANPRSVFIIYGLLLLVTTGGARDIWRLIDRKLRRPTDTQTIDRGIPVAIYGAGKRGQRALQMLSDGCGLAPVVFIDDDPELAGSTVRGVKVIDASLDDLGGRLAKLDVVQIVLAINGVPQGKMVEVLERFDQLGMSVKVAPAIGDQLVGASVGAELRDVSIEDILGRKEVEPDPKLLRGRVAGRSVLITGGAGSIGSELARQIINLEPERLVVLDSSEHALYRVTEGMHELLRARNIPEDKFVAVLGSVCDGSTVRRVLEEYAIDTVYHAAAYKHVPIVESYPDEGVRTNVFGTLTAVDASIAYGVKDFVLVSTDKAVRPTSSMGATKRLAELVVQAKAREQDRTCLSMVRFGNVLGSSGSVVPKFTAQIEAGGPITITDPEVTRYFMSIPEASRLVLQASSLARCGEVFVLDMGEPVRIVDLAKLMVKRAGKRVLAGSADPDAIGIVYLGLRPGEKLHEELFIDAQSHNPTVVSTVYSADEVWMSWSILERKLRRLRAVVAGGDAEATRAALRAFANPDQSTSLSPDIEAVAPATCVGSPDRRAAANADEKQSRVAVS